MEDYTKEDVIAALKKLPSQARKRVLVDQRSYLIGILAYKYGMTELEISNISGYKRDKVHYNKRLPVQFYKDPSYKQNVYVYSVMFPYDFSVVELEFKSNRMKRVELDMDIKMYRKLKAMGAILGHDDIRVTIKFLLTKNITLWEK